MISFVNSALLTLHHAPLFLTPAPACLANSAHHPRPNQCIKFLLRAHAPLCSQKESISPFSLVPPLVSPLQHPHLDGLGVFAPGLSSWSLKLWGQELGHMHLWTHEALARLGQSGDLDPCLGHMSYLLLPPLFLVPGFHGSGLVTVVCP